jgi:hypothetical protein
METTVTPAKKFTWNGNVGTAFASDLGFTCGVTPGYAIYEKMRLGFKVQGKKDTKIFLHVCKLSYAEGEVSGWIYESADGYSLKVFND